jgi:FMN-dependent dehydrogenase
MNPPGADWTYVDRLKKMTGMKLVLKGIDTGEDAKLAREHGADGVIAFDAILIPNRLKPPTAPRANRVPRPRRLPLRPCVRSCRSGQGESLQRQLQPDRSVQ